MANDIEKRITAKMVLDSSGFNNSIQGVNQQLKLAQSEFKASSEKLGAFGSQTDKLRANTEGLSKQIELQRQKVDIYKDSISKTTEKLQANIKARDDLKKSLDQANFTYNEAVKLYGKESEQAIKAKESVNKLTEEYKKKDKQIESNSKQINNYTTNMNKADAELYKLQGDLQKINNELDKSNSKWIKASETLKNSSEKLKSASESINKAGDGLLKISAPLIAGGVASSKFAMDFEDSMAKVSTISDDAQVPLNELGKGILKLSNDTGIAATEIANNVYDAISAGQSTGDAVNFVTNSTKLAKAGFAEAGQSLDLLTTILNAYKMKASEVVNVSDLLIQVQNKGKVTVGELSSDMGKLIPTAVATNTSLKQLGAGYAIMTSNGIKSAESTTYMNSMLNELSKTGSDADKALRKVSKQSFSQLMASGKSLGDVLKILDDYAKKNKLSLSDMFGSAEAGKAALVLSTNAGKDFNSMLKDMTNVSGATNQAFEKVNNTAGQKLNKSLNELKNNAIKLGESLLPVVDKVSDVIGKLADKLGEMDEEQIKTITNVTLLTVGLGGVLKVGSGVVSSVGTITGVMGKLSGALGTATIATEGIGTASTVAVGTAGAGGLAGLGTALSGVAIAAAPWLIAGAAVAGTGYLIYKGMTEEAIPAVDLFADKVEVTTANINDANYDMATGYGTVVTKISEETKKAVSSYVQLDDEATKSLTNLFVNSTAITTDTVNSLVSKYNDMGNQIKSGLDTKYTETLQLMKDFFTKSNALTEEEESKSLENLKANNESQKKETDSYLKQIQDITKKASDEKRALTLEEQQKINSIQEKMREQAVNILSQNEIESKIILERMKSYGTRISAEQSAEIIKNANKTRDDAVKATNEQYDRTITSIVKMRDESKSITTDQANKLIDEANRQKDESIKKAEELRNGVVDKFKQMNPDIEKQVNLQTGTIMTAWDKVKKWWDGLFFKKKTMEVEQVTTNKNSSNNWGVSGGSGYQGNWNMGSNASGTDYWRGGLTTLHEKGYEVYDLPRGTKVYNHEASEDMVLKTAEAVAQKMVSNNSGNNQPIYITVISELDGREIARTTAPAMSEELAKISRRNNYAYGR